MTQIPAKPCPATSARIIPFPSDRLRKDPGEALALCHQAARTIAERWKIFSDAATHEAGMLSLLSRRRAHVALIRKRAEDILAEDRAHIFLTQSDWIALTGAPHNAKLAVSS